MSISNTHGSENLKQKIIQIISVAIVGAIFGLSLGIVSPRKVQSAPSSHLNFQARLLSGSGAIVPDGNYHVEFKLYDAASSGTLLWTETRTTGNLVTVKNGYLSVYLGSVSAFPNTINWDNQLWLTMNIGGSSGSASWDGEMNPRIKLTAVPYAFQAGQLAKTDGANRGTLRFDTVTNNPDLVLPDESGTLCVQGSANCGFIQGSGTAFVQGGNDFGGTTTGNLGTINNGLLNLITNNTTRLTVEAGGNIAMDTNTLYVDATNNYVGIGTSAPAVALDVVGDGIFSDRLQVGPSALVGTISQCLLTLGMGPCDIALDVANAATGNDHSRGGRVANSVAAASASSREHLGLEVNLGLSGAQDYTSSATSLRVTASSSTSGTVTGLMGGAFNVNTLLGTTITTATALHASINGFGGSIGTAHGLQVTNPAGLTSLTNNYGIRVENQTAGTNDYGIYVAGADTYALWVDDGVSRFDGSLEVQSLASADTNTFICRNSLNLLATCSEAPLTSTTGFIQNGNSFDAPAVLGTNDDNSLSFETNNVTRLTLDTAGLATVVGDLAIQGGSATHSLLVSSGATRLVGALEVGAIQQMQVSASGELSLAVSSYGAFGVGSFSGQPIFGVNTIDSEVYLRSTQADLGTSTKNSAALKLAGSYYDGSTHFNDFTLQTIISGITASDYRLAVMNTADTEVFTISGAGNANLVGNITVQGNTTLGDSSTDTLTITGTSVALPNNLNFDSNTLYIDAASNRVGMGTAAPDETLHIVGNIKAVGSMALGNGTTGAVAAGTALRVVHTTDAAADPISCLFGCYAMSLNSRVDSSAGAAAGFSVGVYAQTGTVARAFTLASARGMMVNSTALGAGSTITDNYGLFVANQTAGVNDYGIYVAGADTHALWVDAGATRLDGVTTIGSGLTSGVALTVNGGTSTSNIVNIQDNGTNVFTVADGGNVGIKTGTNAPTADLTFGDGANRTINVLARTTTGAGYNLSVLAGAGNGSNNAGGVLNLQGGSAGSGNANGGNVLLGGGAGVGTGAKGLVVIDTPTITTSATQVCGSNCNISTTNVNNTGAVLISATATGVTASLPDPTITTAGRLMYVTNVGSNDFILSVNGGGASNTIAMKPNTTATMIWNGSDWTAAGASSSTDLQSAYNNTLTSAGGAELVLNAPGGSADGLTIRNNSTTPIEGGILEVQSSIGTNLLSVNSFGTELAANGGAETTGTFSTNWSAAPAGGTITRTTTSGQYVTGQAGVQVATSGTNHGVRNNLSGNPVASTTYQVSFTARLNSGSFTALEVVYSRNGGTNTVPCSDYSTQTLSTAEWTKITCTIETDGTTATNPDLIIRQTDGTSRTFWVDNLSFMRNDDTTQPSNVQIGGGISGGQVTLFTLDRSTAPPVADGDTTYLGSMYYDTNTGRIQCYESDGWGACGSAPDNIITLTPEYTGAVLNGSGIGTMTADFCSNDTALQVNTAFCASGISRNYYQWTSPQASEQEYSIYVSYKLPNTFKEFQDSNTIKLTALTDSMTNGEVGYEVFRSTGSNVTSCGSETIVTTPSADTWYTKSFDGDETACGFAGGNYIIFKINVRASNNANVYVENLDFTYMNQ